MKIFQSGDFKITLCLTQQCNMRCQYCYERSFVDDGHLASAGEMDIDTAKKSLNYLLDELDLKDVKILDLGIFGGEVLLRRELLLNILSHFRGITKAKPFNTQCVISTNGTLLNKSNYEILKSNKIYFVLSIDGDLETHDSNRIMSNADGSFSYIWKNDQQIKDSLECNLCVGANMTVTPITLYKLYESVAFLIDKGFKQIQINFTQEPKYKWNTDDFLYLREQLPAVMRLSQKKGVALFPMEFIKNGYKNNNDYIRCGIGLWKITVDPSGKIIPCSRFYNKFDNVFELGNTQDGTRNKSVFEYLRRIKSSGSLKCSKCEYADTCITYCPYLSLEHGDIYNPPVVMCELNKIFYNTVLTLEQENLKD